MIITEYKNKATTDIAEVIYKNQQLRTMNDIKEFREALELAEDVSVPDRFDLIGIYKNIDLDCHVTGIKGAILNKIKSREFNLYTKDGKKDEEKTKLLKKKWFFDYLDILMDSFFYGYSLIQFGEVVDDKFTKVESIPREYIIPEWKLLKKQSSASSKTDGILFLEDKKYSKQLLWHNTQKLGLFANIAPFAIAKKHLLALALEKAELFGIPMRIGKTDTNNPVLRNQMEKMLDNMGSKAWAVLHESQSLELIENKQGDVHKIFLEPLKMSNQEISKAIAGQTMVFEDGSSYSQSKVHENLFEEFIGYYIMAKTFEVNNSLLPFMSKHGFAVDNLTFRFSEIEKISKLEKTKIITDLSQFYEITPEFVEEYLGIPIEDVKETPEEKTENLYKNWIK